MGRKVRIFHISDLHARSTNGLQRERTKLEAPFRHRVVGDAWNKNLAELREWGPVDLVVFTGDLGDRGHETDYPDGVAFLRRTCDALRVPIDRLFLVPGNHDVARKLEEEAWKALRDQAGQSAAKVSEWLAGGKTPLGFEESWRDAVLTRQATFWSAVADLERDDLAPWKHGHGRLGYQVPVTLEGLTTPLWIVGLDTSWLAGDDHDTGKLRLTDHQVAMHTTDERGDALPGFRLALMHHRFADLADGDEARRLMADRVDLLLHGHQHVPVVEQWSSPDHSLLVLAAGCLYEGDEQHRYSNACQMIEVELSEAGRPVAMNVRFRGWAQRNLFWGDDSLLYENARGGRLMLARTERGWQVQGESSPVQPWRPEAKEVFVGRERELKELEAAMQAGAGARVAVVAVQGMAGVGKSYLVEQFCSRHREQLGTVCRWVLDPPKAATADQGLLELARQAGLDVDHIPPAQLADVLNARPIVIHIDNVDNQAVADVVVELLFRLPARPAMVTGRNTTLGTTRGSGWRRVEVECLDEATSVALLREELEDDSPEEAHLRALAIELGGLPLALHLAAAYIRNGYTAEAFLRSFRTTRLASPLLDEADPSKQSRSRGIVAAAFELSKKLFAAEAERRGKAAWIPALSALGWAPLVGFGRSLGAAVAALPEDETMPFLQAATALSLLRRVPKAERPDGAWSVHPLVAEYLRGDAPRGGVDERIAGWVAHHGSDDEDDRKTRWDALSQERAAVQVWLAEVDEQWLMQVLARCWLYAGGHGPVLPWLEAARRACQLPHPGRVAAAWAQGQLAVRIGELSEALQAVALVMKYGSELNRARAAGLSAYVMEIRGELDEALRIRREVQLPVYERLGAVQDKALAGLQIAGLLTAQGKLNEALQILREEVSPIFDRLGDLRHMTVTTVKIANILRIRGDSDDALRIYKEALPVFESLGDARDKAVTEGTISDLLVERGELDEALLILRELLPVYERLGDVQHKAVTMGKIAGILVMRGELEEALRILREDVLPVYGRVGAIREEAMTMGRIAEILTERGELDEALRILREDVLPVYKRLGAVREKAVTMGQIADILVKRGDLGEALRVHREEALPVYERLGDVRSKATTMGRIADILSARGELDEALRIYREDVLPVDQSHGGGALVAGLAHTAALLIGRGHAADLVEARRCAERAAALAQRMGIPFPEDLTHWLSSDVGRA